jgi:hypothetical protein
VGKTRLARRQGTLGGEAVELVPGVTFKTPEGKRDEVEHNFRADIFRAEVAKLSPLWFEGMTELAAPERRCLAAASIASMFPRTSRTRRHTRLKRHQVVPDIPEREQSPPLRDCGPTIGQWPI